MTINLSIKMMTLVALLLLATTVAPNGYAVVDCSKKHTKIIKKGHGKIRSALGHLQATKKEFKGLRAQAETHTSQANSMINKALGKNKPAKNKSVYEKYVNLCKAQKDLKSAKKLLNSAKLGTCQKSTRDQAIKEIVVAVNQVSQAIDLKKVSCQ